MPRPLDPSRDLLFGLLALQTGLINQAQLVAAFHAWTQATDRPMAAILAEQGALSAPCLTLVEGLVLEHLRRHGNDPERSLAAIGVGRSTRESLAQIGNPDLDVSLAHVGSGSTGHDGDPDRTATYSVGTATSDGQRFRVLRPHARGGLGAVFVALDTELHREVALKQILDHHADDPVSRQRFLLEAEITGGLEHPGIVPVYGLETYGDGRPYYAMRFIRGNSLKEAIERFHAEAALKTDPGQRSLELRKLLRRFTDVCNAVEYAHSRGVLHRDLKPGNVIVGKHGETLVVDWGLAKATGKSDPGSGERTLMPSSASGSAETLPGSALGTPSYMSPEQAEGNLEALGPRSDVYSLGATLFSLLTGQRPFEGDDVGVVLGAVQKGDFPAPRTVDSSIAPALEAVCLKAMATRPEGRYATPRSLADDIERWMADEPVSACPEPFAERARRWMRRRRTVVTAAAAALVVATLGLASVLAVQARANTELTKANGLLTESVRREQKANVDLATANAQVQARFDLALEAIKTFHTGVSEDVLLTNDNLKPVRDRLLKEAAEFYQRLGGQLSGQADRGSRRALGQAYTEMANLAGQIGATEQAIAGHRQALAVRRGLAEATEADGAAKAEVGRSLISLGTLMMDTGRMDEALALYAEARTLLEGLTRAWPAVTQFQRDLAGSDNNVGLLLFQTGKPAEALASYQAARAIHQRLAEANPAVTRFQLDLAMSHNNIGVHLRKTGKLAEALASFQAARVIQQRLAEANPAVTDFQRDLSWSHNNIGVILKETGKPAEALASYQAARAIQQRLAEANPAVTRFQLDLANSHNNIGTVLWQTGKLAEALASFQAARAVQQRLAEANPAVTRFQSGLADSHISIAILLKEIGEPAEALTSLEAARALYQRLAEANPAVTDFQLELANTLLETGDVHRLVGQSTEARTYYERALAIIERVRKIRPAHADQLQMFGLKGLGATQQASGQPADAVESWRRAIASDEWTRSSSSETLYCLAGCHARIGGIAGAAGSGLSAAEGAAELDRAMSVLRRAVAAGYRNFTWMSRDPDLDPLRARTDFQILMMDLAMPHMPFAPDHP
jgi:serine/threonine-protein kinase